MLKAGVFLIKKALADKVSSVFQASLNLLKMILTQFIPKHKLGKAEIVHCVEQTWPNLIARTGDSSTRLRAIAANFIQEMALFREVRSLQLISSVLVKPMKSNMPVRLAQSRVDLLHKLLTELGTGGAGFTLDGVMRFSVGALGHNASEVRETAVQIILAMYRQHKRAVLDLLPTEDASMRKNLVYKKVFDGFAVIDGRPIELLAKEREKTNANTRGKEKEISRPVKAGVRNVHPANPYAPGDVTASVSTCLDSLCIFCGEKAESFTEEGLDLHYWKWCPMLWRCDKCRQVVEISSLTAHLLEECESKGDFAKCERCPEAVLREELTEHVQSDACNPPGSDEIFNHCPMCHGNFIPGEEAWKSHLMGRDGCKQNPRRLAALQRTQLSDEKITSIRTTKQVPSGLKGRSVARASRIPAPKARARVKTRRV